METNKIQSSRNPTKGIDDLSDADETAAAQAATADANADNPKREDSSFLTIHPNNINIVNHDDLDNDAANNCELPEEMDADSIRESTFASMFLGSANYTTNHRNTLAVFHIPGDFGQRRHQVHGSGG